jgi:hypothetical protein
MWVAETVGEWRGSSVSSLEEFRESWTFTPHLEVAFIPSLSF